MALQIETLSSRLNSWLLAKMFEPQLSEAIASFSNLLRLKMAFATRLLLCLFAIVAIASVAQANPVTKSEQQPSNEATQAGGQVLNPQQVLDFGQFQKLYRKTYRSANEMADRSRLFLVRSWRAFVSAVRYKHGQTKYFLKINDRSDWTPQELAATQNHLNLVESSFEGANVVDYVCRKSAHQKLATSQRTKPADERLKSGPPITERKTVAVKKEQDADQPKPQAPPVTLTRRKAANILPKRGLNPSYVKPELSTMGLYEDLHQDPHYKPLNSIMFDTGTKRTYDKLPNRGIEKAKKKKKKRGVVVLNVSRKLVKGLSQVFKLNEKISANFQHVNHHKESLKNEIWIDHRRSKCLAAIQDQGQCGSCYAFATIAFLEWAYCMETGQLVKFSEQYVVDCGSRIHGLNGCHDGVVAKVGIFVNNFGLELAKHYPYRSMQMQCPYDDGTHLKAMGFIRLDMVSVTRVPLEYIEEVIKFAPVIVNVGTNREFYEYGGGVFDGVGCSQDAIHSVLLIGHGREDGEEFWLIRNSQSESYGEEGHLKLNKNSKCIGRVGFMLGNLEDDKLQILPK